MVLTPVMLMAEMLEMAVVELVGVEHCTVELVVMQQELQIQVAVAEVVHLEMQKAALVDLVLLLLKNPQ